MENKEQQIRQLMKEIELGNFDQSMLDSMKQRMKAINADHEHKDLLYLVIDRFEDIRHFYFALNGWWCTL